MSECSPKKPPFPICAPCTELLPPMMPPGYHSSAAVGRARQCSQPGRTLQGMCTGTINAVSLPSMYKTGAVKGSNIIRSPLMAFRSSSGFFLSSCRNSAASREGHLLTASLNRSRSRPATRTLPSFPNCSTSFLAVDPPTLPVPPIMRTSLCDSERALTAVPRFDVRRHLQQCPRVAHQLLHLICIPILRNAGGHLLLFFVVCVESYDGRRDANGGVERSYLFPFGTMFVCRKGKCAMTRM